VQGVLENVLSAALGGLVAFAWAQIAFGNRLTRIETKFEGVESRLASIEKGAFRQLTGRRHWHEGDEA
jgi:hypothetical protein